VPAVYGVVEHSGRVGIILERLEGTDLMTGLGRQPWRIFGIARTTGRTHARLNQLVAPAGIPDMRARLGEKVTRCQAIPVRYRDLALHALETLPDGDRLCHGDFWPGNVMIQQGEPVVLDWTNLSRGDPDADYAWTQMILEATDVPPWAPFVIRMGAKFARSILIVLYKRQYEKIRRPNKRAVMAWRLPVLAARYDDDIESEYPRLGRLIEQQLQSPN
jgi:hypothetical protein